MDKTDRKILYELDLNSKQSFQSLGRKVGLGKETVFHRVQKLKEKGIIDKFITILNVHKLGYTNYRLFLKFKNIDKEIERKIISFFKKSNLTGWVISVNGNWDLGIWFMIKNLFDLKLIYEEFKKKFSNYIANEKLSVFSDVSYFSRSYIIDKPNSYSLDIDVPEDNEELTDSDLVILKELAKNSRIQVIKLADESNLSVKTVIKKINEFERKKIILGYRLKINLDLIGVQYYKIHIKLNNLNERDKSEIDSFILNHPNIIYLDNTISGYDLELDVQVEDKKDLDSLLENIKERFRKNIENYEILEYVKEHKHIFIGL
ncbi:MAG: winged helix-turn-helix transcriptional regulator [Candidatus Woesearchaeota archaeon]